MQNLIEDIKKTEEKAQSIINESETDSLKEIEICKAETDKKKEQEIVEINKKVALFEKQSDAEIQKEIEKLNESNKKEIEKLKKVEIKEVSQKIISKILK